MMKEEEEQGRDCNSPSSPTLPGDILYEILTHVALDDLLRRCRWVCRNWNALTHDSTFNHLHCQRTQSVSGFFVQNLQKNKYHTSFLSIVTSPIAISLDFMPTTNLKIEASSYQAQGLVCCMSQAYHNPPRYYVCKPITRQWRRIPNPKTRYYTEKMAIVVKKSQPLHYKIIRLSRSKKYGGLQCEIFDSKNWAWSMQLEDLKLPGLALESEILMNGSVHWLTFEERKQIFAFDIDKANWRLISLPQSESSSSLEGEEVEAMNIDFEVHKKLVNCEGHLGLLYTTWTWIELWVMEDYLKETWKKKYRLSLEPLNQILGRGCKVL
ncbi:F-box protein At5g49610-like [Macadamia integrifolia]|uniref:F-box protein At5g49610-like n=1 Tax=Macadamia integrifolia TaxID=60698 RepID=UPI001C530F3A|nr:F-box protein At5g49610-like [Macadamia integrifolia]